MLARSVMGLEVGWARKRKESCGSYEGKKASEHFYGCWRMTCVLFSALGNNISFCSWPTRTKIIHALHVQWAVFIFSFSSYFIRLTSLCLPSHNDTSTLGICCSQCSYWTSRHLPTVCVSLSLSLSLAAVDFPPASVAITPGVRRAASAA